MVAQALFIALLAHAAVAYPSGRLSSVFDRVTVGVAYTVILGENLLATSSNCDGCPPNLLLLPLDAGTLDRLIDLQRVLTLVAVAVLMAALVRHWLGGTAAAQRAVAPVVATALVMAMANAGLLLVALGAPLGPDWAWWLVILAATAAVPIAYLGTRVRSRLAGAGVGRLVVEIGAGPLPGQLRASLARALGDPTVEVALWARDTQRYVDGDGRPMTLPAGENGRAVTVLEQAGERVGALVQDPALAEGEGLRAALDSLAERSAIAVDVSVSTIERLPPPVEVAA